MAWLHPWQGATLLLIWVGMLVWGRGAPVYRRLAVPAIGTMLPLAYYWLLGHADAAWKLAQIQSTTGQLPWWALAVTFAPLALLAVPGLLAPADRLIERMTRLWIVAGLVVYFGQRVFPMHALEGLSLPLALLAVSGWRRLVWRPRWGVLAMAAAIIPGAVWSASFYHNNIHSHVAPYIFTPPEHSAMTFLERSRTTGGVLASYYLGMAVPAFTGRSTWVGHYAWTPAFSAREQHAGLLLCPIACRRRVLVRSCKGAITECCGRR